MKLKVYEREDPKIKLEDIKPSQFPFVIETNGKLYLMGRDFVDSTCKAEFMGICLRTGATVLVARDTKVLPIDAELTFK